MARLSFEISPITINGRLIRQVIVDTHIRKHKDITDDVILDLVRQLDHSEQLPEDVKGSYEYFSSLLYLGKKQYRLVWLLEHMEIYIGVLTAYRDKRKK
jgi:hypothetical protein